LTKVAIDVVAKCMAFKLKLVQKLFCREQGSGILWGIWVIHSSQMYIQPYSKEDTKAKFINSKVHQGVYQ